MARKSKWADQAALEALVKYGPQLDVLKEAQQTAKDNYASSVSAANAGKTAIDQAVAEALPATRQIYDQGGLDQLQTANLLSGDLQGLSGVANSIKAGAALEAKGAADGLTLARAQAVGGLEDRQVQAASGAIAARRTAHDTLVSDLAKILQQQSDVSGQKGTFQAATIQSLAQHEADQEFTAGQKRADRRNATKIASAHDETSRQNTTDRITAQKEAATAKRTGFKLATPQQHGAFKDDVANAQTYADEAFKAGHPRSEIAQELVQGVPAQTFTTDPRTGQKLKAAIHDPGVPKKPTLVASVALDLAYDGHVSKRNLRELHRRGLSVRQLGFPTHVKKAPAGKTVNGWTSGP